MDIPGYLHEVQKIRKTGAATELSYRSALQNLFGSIDKDILALNEPKRVKCGAPDFVMSRGDVVFGHAEAKDIDKDIGALKGHDADQKQRFLKALPNLIYTNCLDFEFFRNGKSVGRVTIADQTKDISPKPENFGFLENHLRAFAAQRPQTITSAENLAEIMAGKAALIKDVLFNALREDQDHSTELFTQYSAFQEHLIHDIMLDEFADIYAETVSYGMFAARLHDSDLGTFSRPKALDLLPKSNPFLRALFTYIAGPDLDDRIRWIVDDLAAVFEAADVKRIMENFGSMTGRNDPFLHFYETFLTRYNPAKRKARGVWYTPEPVVNFIVRAVDEVLKSEFGLPLGLADTSKVTIDWDTGQRGLTKRGTIFKAKKNAIEKKDVHRVQILDPATGTGTFLAEVIKQIAPKVKGIAKGMWSQYIEKDLIPRLHGFELLMASYAMCHMKLDMVLSELGYAPSGHPPRFSVYLTNSLEEGDPVDQTLPFAQWLSNEVRQANAIKRDMPIMCVIGNPPYSGLSQNMGDWVVSLIEDYKYVDGVHFGERKHWLHDDYVKFIRLAEFMIEKNGDGVLGFITNHGYLDNPTFRGMRRHLLGTFTSIYVFDLHGNSRKIERATGSGKDQNVFDIMQGVSIVIGIKNSKKTSGLASVYRRDVWGPRAKKYETLWGASISDHGFWEPLSVAAPYFMFTNTDYSLSSEYDEGFGLDDLMEVNTVGIVTARDKFTIHPSKQSLEKTINEFLSMNDEAARVRFVLRKDTQSWKVSAARQDLKRNDGSFTEISFRPFDTRWTYYSGRSGGFLARPMDNLMRHLIGRDNISIAVSKQQKASTGFFHALVHDKAIDFAFVSNRTSEITSAFPLYLYPEADDLDQKRRANFDPAIFSRIRSLASGDGEIPPGEMNVFDYIYGVLYCADYRKRYAAFLKIDFPQIPWPSSPAEFWSVSRKGEHLRRLHLMDSDIIDDCPYHFEGDGDSVVRNPDYRDRKVWINETQHFIGAPSVAWEFQVGGYQPAQKWLKDRKGGTLSFNDVLHYQRIIKVLTETDRIMRTIKMEFGNSVES